MSTPQLPAPVRAARDRALKATDRAAIAAGGPRYQLFVVGSGHDRRSPGWRDLSPAETETDDVDPVRLAVAAIQTVLSSLDAAVHAGTWPADRHWSAANGLRTHLTRTIAKQFAARLPTRQARQQFREAVSQAVRTSPIWMALLEDREVSAAPVTPPEPRVTTNRFPKRAAWLQKQMLKKNLTTANQFAKFVGSDPRTIQKILNGDDVAEAVLEKIATALECRGRDIPKD